MPVNYFGSGEDLLLGVYRCRGGENQFFHLWISVHNFIKYKFEFDASEIHSLFEFARHKCTWFDGREHSHKHTAKLPDETYTHGAFSD